MMGMMFYKFSLDEATISVVIQDLIAESEESNNDQSEDENDFESDQSGKGIDKLMLRAEVRGIPWPIEK